MTVKWNEPLEFFNPETGERRDATLNPDVANPDSEGDYYTVEGFNKHDGIWRPDGSAWKGCNDPWILRNRAPAYPDGWADRARELLDRSGGKGPHMDLSQATPSQLAEWSRKAAQNIEIGWKNTDVFSDCLGGWEQKFLRHVASEFDAFSALLDELHPVDPLVEALEHVMQSPGTLTNKQIAHHLHAELAKRNLEIRERNNS